MTTLVQLLAESKRLGFLGPGAVADHIEHAQAFLAAMPAEPRRALDLGSGGGVPGLVLVEAWPATEWTLVDAQLRRVRFLEDAVEALGCGPRVQVVHGRAEDLAHEPGHREQYDIVTARSFGPPGITAECGVGFLAPSGCLLVSEPPSPEADRWPTEALATLGLADEGPAHGPSSAVRVLRAVEAPPSQVPRRHAAMVRRARF